MYFKARDNQASAINKLEEIKVESPIKNKF